MPYNKSSNTFTDAAGIHAAHQAACARANQMCARKKWAPIPSGVLDQVTAAWRSSPTRTSVLCAADALVSPLLEGGLASREAALEVLASYLDSPGWDQLSAALGGRPRRGRRSRVGDSNAVPVVPTQALSAAVEPMTDHEYTLHVNSRQRSLLVHSLDMAARLMRGDLSHIPIVYAGPRNRWGIDTAQYADMITSALSSAQQTLARFRAADMAGVATMAARHERIEALRRIAGNCEDILGLDREDVLLLIAVTDSYSRVGMGQFGIVGEVFLEYSTGPYYQVCHELIDGLKDLQVAVTGFSRNAGHGIHSPDLDDWTRVVYDLQKVLRYRIAQDGPGYEISVWSNVPRQSSNVQPLARIESRAEQVRATPAA